ncbi:hypothetical protein SDC9_76728 [bioreactor metagenome]|uniref:DUF4143 domain-containing protein n=1 Tax=bioreactor metagenome TaxID=1076179 RepID=A0A644YQN6_9ZZZZ
MITLRDLDVVEYIKEHRVAKTSTIQKLFYPSYPVAARRLAELVRCEYLKRERDNLNMEYVYYIKRPKQLRHAVLLSDFLQRLSEQVDIKKTVIEPQFGDIRPDAAVGYELSEIAHIALIEVEVSHKGFDHAKYKNLVWEKFFPMQPELFIISDGKIGDTGLKQTVIKTNLDFKISAPASYQKNY